MLKRISKTQQLPIKKRVQPIQPGPRIREKPVPLTRRLRMLMPVPPTSRLRMLLPTLVNS